MKIYARIQNGVVAEIVRPATYDADGEFEGIAYRSGDEIPIERRFHPDIVEDLVDITGVDPTPAEHWEHDGGTFRPPR